MCPEDIHSFLKRLVSDPEQNHGFVHPDTVDTVSCLELSFLRDGAAKLYIAVLFRFRDKKIHAFALCLSHIQEIHIVSCKIHAVILHCKVIGVPSIESFHYCSPVSEKAGGGI